MPLLNYILTDGPASATPLIIAHGLFGSARNWNVIAKKLATDRRVVAVDMRNHGDSFRDPDHSYAALARDLAEVIGQTGGTAHVLGHSMGGKAAMALALTRPDLVRRLIVADIAPVPYDHRHDANIAAMRAVDLGKVTRRADADAQLARHIADAGLRGFFLQSLAITADGASWKLNFDALAQNAAAITGFPEFDASFTGPTLFVRGANSDYIRPGHQQIIRALFPKADVAELAGAGHWLQADKPSELIAAIKGFLTD